MDKWNYKRVVMFTIALLAVVTVFSVSFAYFTIELREGELFTTQGGVNPGTMPEINFTENQEGVSLTNTYPMPDSAGIKVKDVYTYTVENTDANKAVNVVVSFEVLNNSTLEDNLVNYLLNGSINTLVSNNTTKTTSTNYKTAYVIDTYTLAAGASKTSNLKLWINENGTLENAQNKRWSGRIVVSAAFLEE